MTEDIDFTKPEPDNKIDKTEDEIIDRIAQKDVDDSDLDAIVKKHETQVRNAVSQEIILEMADGAEISYNRIPDPKCNVCKCACCEEAEQIYISTGFDLSAVRAFFKEQGLSISHQSVRKHFEKHCEFGEIRDNWLVKAQIRKDEMMQHRQELTEIFMGDVVEVMAEVRSDLKECVDVKDKSALYSNLSKFMGILQNYEKLRAEKSEFQSEISQEIIESQREKLQNVFIKLLEGAPTEEERKRIAQLLHTFEDED